MASSNRHWPSMFKSKPHHHHQWQHDINSSSLLPSACQKSSAFTSGCEERSPEPKPRWNPKPEQIRILEAIFNSGMVNPPRDEIRRIRAQLQEYGQVGDANVFYWFQNRKSRSKHKLRLLQNSKQMQSQSQSQSQLQSSASAGPNSVNSASPSSSSSSSSPKCAKSTNNSSQLHYKSKNASSSSNVNLSLGSPVVVQKSVAASVNNPRTMGIFPAAAAHHAELPDDSAFLFPVSTVATGGSGFDHNITTTAPQQLGFGGFGESIMSNMIHHQNPSQEITQERVVGPCTSLLLSEMMNVNYGSNLSVREHEEMRMKMLQTPICFSTGSNSTPTSYYTNMAAVPCPTSASVTVPSTSDQLQVHVQEATVVAAAGAERVVVFINDMAFEVAAGPFNVKEAFGEEAVLINSAGEPLLTDEWGLSLQPLQHGASYYLI